jgi:serine/threonine protein kinase
LALSRGRRESEPRAILVLAAVSESPTFGTLDRLEHEYSLRELVDPNWAARPLALSRLQGRMALVLQDPGGTPLQRFIGQPMELTRFLRFAVVLATAVGRLHELGFIQKDIKPSNFLVDMASGNVWLTGFLIEALQKMVERSNIPGRSRCNFHSTWVIEESLSSSVQQYLLRIAQEATSNALRHAKPTVISVHLGCNPDHVVLEVTDNGSGIADYQAMTREGFGFPICGLAPKVSEPS